MVFVHNASPVEAVLLEQIHMDLLLFFDFGCLHFLDLLLSKWGEIRQEMVEPRFKIICAVLARLNCHSGTNHFKGNISTRTYDVAQLLLRSQRRKQRLLDQPHQHQHLSLTLVILLSVLKVGSDG